jgi:hypothetical protein
MANGEQESRRIFELRRLVFSARHATTVLPVTFPMGHWSKQICKLPLTSPNHRRPARISRFTVSSFSDAASVVITRKKYIELPRTRMLEDGSPAPPLDAYVGSLDIKDVNSFIPSAHS